jgi:DNA-binding XRE family transcriptional regulator
LLQLSLGLGANEASVQQNGAVLDWIRLRRELANLRRDSGLEEIELAKQIGVHKTTVYRVEDVDRLPNHKPDLKTVDAWLVATDGPEIDEFFRRLKTPAAEISSATRLHARNTGDTTTHGTQQQESLSHGARLEGVVAPTEALTDVVEGLTALSVDLAKIAARAKNRLAVAAAHRDRSGQSRPPARLERTVPPAKKRVSRRSK